MLESESFLYKERVKTETRKETMPGAFVIPPPEGATAWLGTFAQIKVHDYTHHHGDPYVMATTSCSRGDALGFYLNAFIIFPRIIFIGLTVIAFIRYIELYFVWLTVVIVANDALNHALQHLFRDPPPFGLRCGDLYGFPDWSSQRVACFMTLIVTYSWLWRRNLRFFRRALYVVLAVLTGLVRWYNRYNTWYQILAGWLVGILFGLCANVFTYYFIRRKLKMVLSIPPLCWLPIRTDMIDPPLSELDIHNMTRDEIIERGHGAEDFATDSTEVEGVRRAVEKMLQRKRYDSQSLATRDNVTIGQSPHVLAHLSLGEGKTVSVKCQSVGAEPIEQEDDETENLIYWRGLPMKAPSLIDETPSFGELSWPPILFLALSLTNEAFFLLVPPGAHLIHT